MLTHKLNKIVHIALTDCREPYFTVTYVYLDSKQIGWQSLCLKDYDISVTLMQFKIQVLNPAIYIHTSSIDS